MNTDQLREYVALSARKAALKAELDDIQRQLSELEPQLIEAFADEGVQNINVDGHTVYLSAQLWASPVDGDYERACDALIAAGLGEFVGRRFNTNTLSAWIREYVRDETGNYPDDIQTALPQAFNGAIEARKDWSLRVRKAAGRGRR